MAGTELIANGLVPGGLSRARIKAAATTNDTLVKAGTINVYGWTFQNNTAAKKYIRVYDKATQPVVGTDVPQFTLILQANSELNFETAIGTPLLLGFGYGISNAVGDTDTTVTAVDDVHGVFFYGF